jgi:hypothetical protein
MGEAQKYMHIPGIVERVTRQVEMYGKFNDEFMLE